MAARACLTSRGHGSHSRVGRSPPVAVGQSPFQARTFVRILGAMLGCLLVVSFPLACELTDHEELVGAPAAVVDEKGAVLAASAQAEAHGVQAGQAAREAIGRCPTLAVLEERPARARAFWEEIRAALELVPFTVEPGVPGEAY